MTAVYFTQNVLGAFLLDEEGKRLTESLSPFKTNEIIDYLIDLEEGKVTQQAREVLEKAKSMGFNEVVVETIEDGKIASSLGLNPRVDVRASAISRFRERLQ
ncbi:MAG: C/D box methylation guide ribonucleoprotein complex aNOP56 subunit, partial [Thermogladius sp.]